MRCFQVNVVVKAVFDGGAGGELSVRPETEDGSGHDMRGGVPDALQFGHFAAVVESLTFLHIYIAIS